jgi:hypothetical protein
MKMKNKLILTENRIFYCLKHLKKLNKQTNDYLIEKGHDLIEIQQQIGLIGSKFFSSFCQSPIELYDKITDRVPSKIIHQENGNVTYCYTFEENIGFDSIIAISELNSKERNSIVLENRNQYEVKVIRKNKRNGTKKLNVVFQKNSNEIITMFPGIYAPPLPAAWMNKEELLIANEFWEKHVFIV